MRGRTDADTTTAQHSMPVAGTSRRLSRWIIMETIWRVVRLTSAQAHAASGGLDANEVA